MTTATETQKTASPELDEATKHICKEKSEECYDQNRNRLVALVEANPNLLKAGDGPWVCPGPLSFSGVVFVKMEGRFLYPPGPTQGYVKFEGELIGLAAVHGESVGFATFAVPRNELVGEVSCQVNAGGVGPGLVEINWWRGDKYIGTFVGGGLIEGVAIVGGKGKFHLA